VARVTEPVARKPPAATGPVRLTRGSFMRRTRYMRLE
jgi:hypothetical protein